MIVRLARINVPLGKPLSDDDRIDVQWTIDDGVGDAETLQREGKAALRQRRLRRLLAEAQSQGAAPTDADLAQALDVAVRTIERDLQALRDNGVTVTTRRRK
jgi:biotin operon repressor